MEEEDLVSVAISWTLLGAIFFVYLMVKAGALNGNASTALDRVNTLPGDFSPGDYESTD